MRLTPRMRSIINEIIQGEVQTALRNRRGLSINEKLNVGEIDKNVVLQAVKDQIDGKTMDSAQDFVYDFSQECIKTIANEINKHAVATIRVDPQELRDELDDLYADDITELHMEKAIAIAGILMELAERLVDESVGLVGGLDAEDR